MRKIILLLLFGAVQNVHAQNPYWAFPPNYVDFTTGGGTVTTLGGGTKTKASVSNAIFTQSGTLQIYSAGPTLSSYNRSDGSASNVSNSTANGDFAYVPIPGTCNSYLVPWFNLAPSGAIGSWLQQIDFNGTSGSCNQGSPYSLVSYTDYTTALGFYLGMAAPVTPNIPVTGKAPFLYMVGNPNGTTDLKVDIFYVQSGPTFGKTTFTLENTYGSYSKVLETELSHDGTKLAVCMKGRSQILLVDNIASCLTGTCTPSNVTTITVPNSSSVNGIEFSPDSSKLFYTKTTPIALSNQVGYVTLATSTHTEISSTQNMGGSYIEYATDGYMYVSDGSALKGFSLASTPYAFSKTISGVTNSTFDGVYTLPDQIDGANYSYLGGDCQNGSVSITSNPFPSATKVNGTITASGSASVTSGSNVSFTSNTSVILQPNFTSLSGSSFVAKIVPCNITCTANACTTSTSYRLEEMEEPLLKEKGEYSTLHPNPISAGYLQFGKMTNSYSLTNSSGNLVQQGKNADKLDVTGLAKGLYLLKLDDKVEKVIVQ